MIFLISFSSSRQDRLEAFYSRHSTHRKTNPLSPSYTLSHPHFKLSQNHPIFPSKHHPTREPQISISNKNFGSIPIENSYMESLPAKPSFEEGKHTLHSGRLRSKRSSKPFLFEKHSLEGAKHVVGRIRRGKNIGSLAAKMKEMSRRFKLGADGRPRMNGNDDSSWMKDVRSRLHLGVELWSH